MTLQVGLNLVTMTLCIVTLAMATAALAPHLKQAVVLLRDGLLWLTLLAVVGGVAAVGWGRFFKIYTERLEKQATPAAVVQPEEPSKEARPPTKPVLSRPSISRQLAEKQPNQPAFRANRSRSATK